MFIKNSAYIQQTLVRLNFGFVFDDSHVTFPFSFNLVINNYNKCYNFTYGNSSTFKVEHIKRGGGYQFITEKVFGMETIM